MVFHGTPGIWGCRIINRGAAASYDIGPPEREGYVFQGWFTSSTGTNRVMAGMTVSVTANQNLYAHWKGVESTVTLDPNEGSCKTGSMEVCRGEDYGTLPVPERYGYKFLGWYTATEGGGRITASSEVTEYQDHTLYALWEPKRATVVFYGNGGSLSEGAGSKEVVYQGGYGGMPIPERDGFRFLGWYTMKSGGTRVTEETAISKYVELALYAGWEKEE